MQSAPNLKEADPHDIFAIESVLAAHAQKSPPIAPESERVAPPIAPQSRAAAPQAHAVPQIQAAAPVFVGPSAPPADPTFDIRDVPANDVGPAEIKLDGLGPLGPQPTSRWAKRLFIAGLGLAGAVTAAGWQHYGDEAKAMANEWVPPSILAALSPVAKTTAEQPAAAAEPAVATDQSGVPATAAAAPAAAVPSAVITAAPPPAAAISAEAAQLQSMAHDLATMGAQVEELKATIAQLKAGQAQMTRELAKASEAKASDAKAEVKAPEPRVAAVAPPPPVRPTAPPVRKPRPPAQTYSSSSYAPSYSPSPAASPAATGAPLPLVQAAPPPAPVRQTLADDGQPVVRPPMPLR